MGEVTEEVITARLKSLIGQADLAKMTIRNLRTELAEEFGSEPLSPFKGFIKSEIVRLVQRREVREKLVPVKDTLKKLTILAEKELSDEARLKKTKRYLADISSCIDEVVNETMKDSRASMEERMWEYVAEHTGLCEKGSELRTLCRELAGSPNVSEEPPAKRKRLVKRSDGE
eukprot:Rmarinus@m.1125